MLNPGEVAHVESNLDVDSPDHTSEHCCPHWSHVCSHAIGEGCIDREQADNDKEGGEGCIDAIAYPTDDTVPIKE